MTPNDYMSVALIVCGLFAIIICISEDQWP
jgi:hypothetical protein